MNITLISSDTHMYPPVGLNKIPMHEATQPPWINASSTAPPQGWVSVGLRLASMTPFLSEDKRHSSLFGVVGHHRTCLYQEIHANQQSACSSLSVLFYSQKTYDDYFC